MHRATPSSDRDRIVELFARRQPTYAPAAVLTLLGISHEQLLAAVENGSVEQQRDDRGEIVIPWEDVAVLALEEWTPRMIEGALGNEADEIIPLLNQHRLIRVSLPIYLIRLLDHVACFESATRHVPRNASDILERVLHDYTNAQDINVIDAEVPGFAQALTKARSHRRAPLCEWNDLPSLSHEVDGCSQFGSRSINALISRRTSTSFDRNT